MYLRITSEKYNTYIIPADILHHALDTAVKDNYLTVIGMIDTVNTDYTVSDPACNTYLLVLSSKLELLDSGSEYRDDVILRKRIGSANRF